MAQHAYMLFAEIFISGDVEMWTLDTDTQIVAAYVLAYTYSCCSVSCSVLTDSATICVCLSIAFFLSSFDHGTFEEVATVSYGLMVSIFEFENETKG
jgi:hypothetical protein